MRPLIKWLTLLLFLPLFNSCAVFGLLNSGTVNLKYTSSEAKFNGVKYENKNRIGRVSVSIRNVQHPQPYGKWNFNVRLTPSLHFDDILYGTGKIDPERPPQPLPDIEVRRFIGMGNLKFTTHTPIGAFALTGGFGGAISHIHDGYGLDTVRTTEIRRVDLAYVAFLSKRFFFLMGPRYYKEQYESYVFAVRLGYFWGSVSK